MQLVFFSWGQATAETLLSQLPQICIFPISTSFVMLPPPLLQNRRYVWCRLHKLMVFGGFFWGHEGTQGQEWCQGPGALLGVRGDAAGLATRDPASDLDGVWGHGLTPTGVITQKASGRHGHSGGQGRFDFEGASTSHLAQRPRCWQMPTGRPGSWATHSSLYRAPDFVSSLLTAGLFNILGWGVAYHDPMVTVIGQQCVKLSDIPDIKGKIISMWIASLGLWLH